MNKLESCTTKRTGLIENFISNMKCDSKKTSKNVFSENTDNKERTSKMTSAEDHQSVSMDSIHNTEIKPTENKIRSKSVNLFKPKEKKLNFKQQPAQLTSVITPSVTLHQYLNNIKLSEIDPAFLNALPADLRQELENELKAKEYENKNKSESIEHKNTTAIMEITITEESSRLYQHVHADQMKEFVEEWVTTENEPKNCDNIMVSEYLCNLIKDKKTEDAYEILRKLYR